LHNQLTFSRLPCRTTQIRFRSSSDPMAGRLSGMRCNRDGRNYFRFEPCRFSSHLRSWVEDSLFQISDFRFQISDFRFGIWDLGLIHRSRTVKDEI
jgi:hypothetical protein